MDMASVLQGEQRKEGLLESVVEEDLPSTTDLASHHVIVYVETSYSQNTQRVPLII